MAKTVPIHGVDKLSETTQVDNDKNAKGENPPGEQESDNTKKGNRISYQSSRVINNDGTHNGNGNGSFNENCTQTQTTQQHFYYARK
ncbi:hypothetical protein AAZX31_15G135700 [Glycine max]|uniref:Uncharacterized protein n=2 Tax=Glycine subgen. Soja TaxID=1462606 RepID=K7MBB0_SOYBN|nr:hypothetical protein JHK85_042962 [Glycine max]KHN14674.1 hypothetical protein glysoja_024769 [Glycine soja]KAG5105324.1 hypothetical protein JHK82_042294 [Glycine max]KAG5116449.1 hypothetical protein JHK84_042562 [Glycine max]KAH1147132.1 hypothetical protein GYH30_042345 [Glycine max]